MRYFTLLLTAFLFSGFAARAQESDTSDSLGLPGDNLDLAGVLELFKTSTSLEAFEKAINDPDKNVNNLDLNGDNDVDYIRVVDNVDSGAHAIVLQVPVNDKESQDVAVIELDKNGDASAQLQIVGDEELYGADYVVEPTDEKEAKTKGPSPFFDPMPPPFVVVNVWMWPCVRFIYAPAYVVWVSPWRWHAYPPIWHPWHPVPWHVHYAHAMHYHYYCHHVHVYRVARAHRVYDGHRMGSPSVHRNYAPAHERHEAMRGNGNANHNGNAERGGKGNGGQKNNVQRGGTHDGNKTAPRGGNKSGGNKSAPRGGGNQRGGGGQHGGGGGKHGGGGGHHR